MYLEAFDETVIRHVVTRVDDNDDKWVVVVDTYFAQNRRKSLKGLLRYIRFANKLNDYLT